ncbi:winged helix-turn-helix domain-containing protein [Pseudomonas agarici]|uniref:winged helix-turn-helix domain-containing protein n=1 Tax=Pseudomonas agarici TaxID=46677 RepID=UPI0009E8FB5E|nr:winged helix-turn-helix domain-containing protein [Pseudomonas agarici]
MSYTEKNSRDTFYFLTRNHSSSDKSLKRQEDRKTPYMDFSTEVKNSFNNNVFYTYTAIVARQKPATYGVFTSESRSKNACTVSDVWSFRLNKRELSNANTKISLTAIESLLLKQLVLSHRRVCSKKELILAINRDPSNYTGLEMCLSRLQDKFNSAYGKRLFRSVRNRGYCLVQDVKVIA